MARPTVGGVDGRVDARIPWLDPDTGRGGTRRVVSAGRRCADGGPPPAGIGTWAAGDADSRRVGREVRTSLHRPAESALPLVRRRRYSCVPLSFSMTLPKCPSCQRFDVEFPTSGTVPARPSSNRRPYHSSREMPSARPEYIVLCVLCEKRFRRTRRSTRLRPHKDHSGWDCLGRSGYLESVE